MACCGNIKIYKILITDIPEPDIAVSMGCGVKCPFIGRAFDEDWGLTDPTGQSDAEFRNIIAMIVYSYREGSNSGYVG